MCNWIILNPTSEIVLGTSLVFMYQPANNPHHLITMFYVEQMKATS